MQPGDPFEVTARVVGTMAPGVFEIELRNGHRLVGHLPQRLRTADALPGPGAEVRVRVSPFDMSDGLILREQAGQSADKPDATGR